jgi:hypothetical protein
MKNRHRVSQVVSKIICSRGGRRKILKQRTADCGQRGDFCRSWCRKPIASAGQSVTCRNRLQSKRS